MCSKWPPWNCLQSWIAHDLVNHADTLSLQAALILKVISVFRSDCLCVFFMHMMFQVTLLIKISGDSGWLRVRPTRGQTFWSVYSRIIASATSFDLKVYGSDPILLNLFLFRSDSPSSSQCRPKLQYTLYSHWHFLQTVTAAQTMTICCSRYTLLSGLGNS